MAVPHLTRPDYSDRRNDTSADQRSYSLTEQYSDEPLVKTTSTHNYRNAFAVAGK